MHQNASHTEGDQKKNQQNRNNSHHTAGHPDAKYHKHRRDHREGYKHLKAVYHEFREQKNIFGQIDPCNDSPVGTHHFHTSRNPSGEEIPHRDAYKNKDRKIWFRRIKNNAKHDRIDQHHAKRFDQPPHPVQKRVGYLCLQICLRGADSVGKILSHITEKSDKVTLYFRHGNSFIQKPAGYACHKYTQHGAECNILDSI